MCSLPDSAWEEIQKGDLKTFEKLYKKLFPRLSFYACKILKDKFISEEVVQDAFLKIWQNRKSIFIKGSITSYLYTVTHHLAINSVLKKATLKNKVNQNVTEDTWQKIQNTFAVTDYISKKLEADETEKQIKAIIDTLPNQCKMIFILSRYENIPNQEIAQILSISIHTVRTQLYRAIEKIMKEMEK